MGRNTRIEGPSWGLLVEDDRTHPHGRLCSLKTFSKLSEGFVFKVQAAERREWERGPHSQRGQAARRARTAALAPAGQGGQRLDLGAVSAFLHSAPPRVARSGQVAQGL